MIRSLTIGLPVGDRSSFNIETGVGELLKNAATELGGLGIEVRTARFSLPPVGSKGETEGSVLSILRWVDRLSDLTGVRWFCLPFDFISEGPRRERLQIALEIIGQFPKLFVNIMAADREKLSVPAINDAAALVLKISKKSNNGFDNFRVGVSCGCPPNSPFFPCSHHEGEGLTFSFALETTNIALKLADDMGPRPEIDGYRDALIEHLTPFYSRIQEAGDRIAAKSKCQFGGIDASFAPFPDGRMSVGALVEKLSGMPIGSHGSVFITGLLTDAIRAALLASSATPIGFNGVMYSILEDNVLASANNRRSISLDALLALSSMCGCGIDMVPIPGASFPEEISSLMLDVAAMSLSLKKPLGVRVLPIPGRAANEFTHFNLDFLCDSRVIGLTANGHGIKSKKHAFGMTAPSRLSTWKNCTS